jgi:peroxiredoxin
MRPTITLLAAVFLYTATAGCSAGTGRGQLVPIPDLPVAPAFDLAGPDGKRVRLSDFLGKPLIVNFWATWCPPCRAEMPSIQRAWEQLQGEGIGVIAINVGEDADTIRQFTDRSPVTFPLPMDLDSRVVQSWPVRGLPTTFVVDPEGRLAYIATGEREWDDPDLLSLVRALKAISVK